MKSLLFAFSLVYALDAAAAVSKLPEVELQVKGIRVTAEVAATSDSRTNGLMRRFSLQPDHGMLFVFSEPQPLAFWMRNTFIPLSIAFIDAEGKILNVEDMAPQTETTHPSRGLALYALEMKKGWFAQHGVGPGDSVRFPPAVPKASE